MLIDQQSSARSIYGYALHLTSNLLCILYLLWAFIPDTVFHSIGLNYLPPKHLAITVPITICSIVFISMALIDPLYNYLHIPNPEARQTVTDSFARKLRDHHHHHHQQHHNHHHNNQCTNRQSMRDSKQIAPISDLPSAYVSQILYLES